MKYHHTIRSSLFRQHRQSELLLKGYIKIKSLICKGAICRVTEFAISLLLTDLDDNLAICAAFVQFLECFLIIIELPDTVNDRLHPPLADQI